MYTFAVHYIGERHWFDECLLFFFNMSLRITNIDMIHDVALNNQIQSQLLREDLHPAPDIFATVQEMTSVQRNLNIAFVVTLHQISQNTTVKS